jgi:hypothetical protein
LSTPDLLYHHHHVSHSTLPLPHHHAAPNLRLMNHATAAATLNRCRFDETGIYGQNSVTNL